MPRRSGRARAAILAALFVVATLGGCSATKKSDPRAMSAAEESEVSEDEILSPPYGDEEDQRGESAEEKAGGTMVATLFVGVILALAAIPFLLFGPLGLL